MTFRRSRSRLNVLLQGYVVIFLSLVRNHKISFTRHSWYIYTIPFQELEEKNKKRHECLPAHMYWNDVLIMKKRVSHWWHRGLLVGGGSGKGRCRQSDPLVCSVVDRVESLEKDLAEDKVQSRSTRVAYVSNNQIYFTGGTTNPGVEVTRPDLSIRREFKRSLGGKGMSGCCEYRFQG